MKLDLADPAIRIALHPRRGSGGVWRWFNGDYEVAAIGYIWSGPSARLTLSWAHDRRQHKQTVAMQTSRPFFGGRRYWFACPISGRRARALFLAPDARQWASRVALRLPYASQHVGAAQRYWMGLVDAAANRERRNAVRCVARAQRHRS